MLVWNGNGYSVYKAGTHRCACYIIKSGKNQVLVDTSMKFERNAVASSVRHLGIHKIDAIFLTHSHTDHVANARYFSDYYHCRVYISPKGIDRVRNGNCIMPKGIRPYSRLICLAEQKIPFYSFVRFEACQGAEALNGEVVGAYLGEQVKLLETPGHTDDSISIVLNDDIAIVGDTMVNVLGNKYPPFADDEEAVKTSWSKLLGTKCKLFCPAHGKPFQRDELMAAYRKHVR